MSTKVETHLKNIGLLSNSKIYYEIGKSEKDKIGLKYFSELYYLYPKQGAVGTGDLADLCLQCFPFTEIGNELAPIAGATSNEKYIKLLAENDNLVISS